MRIVYMGTPDFAVPCLRALLASRKHEVVGVFTQPDRYRGKKEQVSFSPVKQTASEAGIPVYQPERLRHPGNFELLEELAPDIIVVVSYGQILPKNILELPRYGCINVHASLLPKYRGAAPIQWAILNGEKETGVTIMQMAEGLDTGDMLTRVIVPITEDETGETLFEKLAACSPELLLTTLEQIEEGKVSPKPQDDAESCYARMLQKSIGCLDFSKTAVELERYVRGLNSWPSAYTYLAGQQLKLWRVTVNQENSTLEPGTISKVTADSFLIQTAEGQLVVQEVQLQGKKRMDAAAFLRGNALQAGIILTKEP